MPVQTIIKHRRDTAANWTSTNPTLAAGELGLETDTSKFKFGNGTSTWTSLAYSTPDYTSSVQHAVKAGVALTKGQAVYVSSANGTNMIVSKASNGAEATSSKTMGLITSTLSLNDIGNVISEGLLTGLNTSIATAGDPVWLGTSGNLIYGNSSKPVAPAHLVFIGIVTRVHSSNGEIFVKIQNGFELEELHNVLITSPGSNNLLAYETSTSLWKNKTASQIGLAALNHVHNIGDVNSLQDALDAKANIANPTFSGRVTTDNLTVTNSALVKGEITVRNDVSLTGVIGELGYVTAITRSTENMTFWTSNPSGFISASTNLDGSFMSIFLASETLKSALTTGATLVVDGNTVTISTVSLGVPYSEVSFTSAIGSYISNITSIAADVPKADIATDNNSLSTQVSTYGTPYLAIGDKTLEIASLSISGNTITAYGDTSMVQEFQSVTIRSDDTSKINGVKYDGTLTSITFDPLTGKWLIPDLYIYPNQVNYLETWIANKADISHLHSITDIYDYVEPQGESFHPFLLMGA